MNESPLFKEKEAFILYLSWRTAAGVDDSEENTSVEKLGDVTDS